jgi:hypothetical protein
MKYIVINHPTLGELISVFPKHIRHDRFYESIRQIRFGGEVNWEKTLISQPVVSGGFVSPDGVCYGVSESLGVKSRVKQDTALLGIGHH